eukprot:3234543-Prymnesium_polylepis.2
MIWHHGSARKFAMVVVAPAPGSIIARSLFTELVTRNVGIQLLERQIGNTALGKSVGRAELVSPLATGVARAAGWLCAEVVRDKMASSTLRLPGTSRVA